ncbi:hypothetical protein NDU88_003484 [Pleurodeles waltl]|uniref:Uncharacterized protein n=1 Tax=Pleurodeles waltl TaxID=8319 RepID=A0AAV7KVN0_PLEWA|nr:hypothetical protein NDU88_003484 [Pleurodeles waltl]
MPQRTLKPIEEPAGRHGTKPEPTTAASTKEGLLASFLTPELDAWVSQESSVEIPGSSNDMRGRLEVSKGEENQLNDEKGAEGRPDHIINTINVSSRSS